MQEVDPEKLDFVLLLNEKGANEANKHVPLYMKKNLMTKFDSLADLVTWMASRERDGSRLTRHTGRVQRECRRRTRRLQQDIFRERSV